MKRSEAREQAFALTFERTINRESVSRIIDAAGLSKDMIVDDFAERLARVRSSMRRRSTHRLRRISGAGR